MNALQKKFYLHEETYLEFKKYNVTVLPNL